MESDIRYYRRRACEEMVAAQRAVTGAARERRLRLVDLYVQRHEAHKAASPFGEQDFVPARRTSAGRGRSAFTRSSAGRPRN